MKCQYLLILILVTFIGCKEENLIEEMSLKGKWVEVNDRQDTLTFGLFGEQESMILDRGTEMRNGFILPKSGSGSYEYELLDAKISIRWLLSSNFAFTEYYFDITGDKLQIEKFYDNNSVLGTILTFERRD